MRSTGRLIRLLVIVVAFNLVISSYYFFDIWYSLESLQFIFALVLVFVVALLIPRLKSFESNVNEEKNIQRQREEKLQKRLRLNQSKAAYFEKVLETSKDPLFTTDREGLILKFNQGASELFGYEALDVVGKPVRELFRDQKEFGRLIKKVEARGHANALDIRAFSCNEKIIHVSLSVSKMENPLSNELSGMVFGCQDISRRKVIEREMRSRANELEALSRTDDLTGLNNSRQFHEDLSRMIVGCQENPGRVLTLMLMDLDHFKTLNDTQGHQAGDEALKHFSDAIRKGIRQEVDPAYRYGGDEFVILFPDADSSQVAHVATRIAQNYDGIKDPENPTTVSVGVVTYDGHEDQDVFFQRADDAMYTAKKSGGGQVYSV